MIGSSDMLASCFKDNSKQMGKNTYHLTCTSGMHLFSILQISLEVPSYF